MTTTGTLPGTIKFYNLFLITWELEYRVSQDPVVTATIPAGVSDNRLYCVLGAPPADVRGRYESVAECSCLAADGLDGAPTLDEVWSALWEHVQPLGVKRKYRDGYNKKDNAVLRYYELNCSSAGVTATVVAKLLETGTGQCGAWADYLQSVGVTQAIQSNKQTIVLDPAGSDAALSIKNWTIINQIPSGTGDYPYLHPTDVDENCAGGGIPGQNNTVWGLKTAQPAAI